MDRAEASRIAHGELRLWNPLREDALDEAIAVLDLAPGAGVLDVACGRAEVLRRVAERWDVRGSGYDADPTLIESGPAGLDLQVRDSPPTGPFELVICIASSHALGGFPEALGALRDLTAPGGQVLLGEGYWRRPPSGEYLEALGGASANELPDYRRLMRAAADAGLTPLHAWVASEADWDRYEWRLTLNAERWAAAHPADPGADVLRERARVARERMTMPEGRETLGFALVLLRRDFDPEDERSRIA
jgi:SAM-dependent methyltransferase